ncbi:MAG TPA: hypothetical protein VF665_16680 [Longimicrobium sp.]|uniref:hypothetical protein n=1 Tax=Longimicrobium sp. TaxID=2029185 RepID=UPI002EDA3B14
MTRPKPRNKNKRVPFWITMDLGWIRVVAIVGIAFAIVAVLQNRPRTGSIAECLDQYDRASTARDSARVDSLRPFGTKKMPGESCGSLRKTPAYARALHDRHPTPRPAG